MTRLEHNAHWSADREPDNYVCCNLSGYGELDQYDPHCPACWLGHAHKWATHDQWLLRRQAEINA